MIKIVLVYRLQIIKNNNKNLKSIVGIHVHQMPVSNYSFHWKIIQMETGNIISVALNTGFVDLSLLSLHALNRKIDLDMLSQNNF